MKALTFMLIFAIFVIDNSFAQQATCDYKVEILINNSEFESKDFSWRMRATKIEGKSTNITGTAEIEDSKGNIVKRYKPWTNDSISKQKTSNTYSPNLNQGEYKIISRINVECDDINKDTNIDVKVIKINEKNEEIINIIDQSNSQNTFIEDKTNNTAKSETINPSIDKKIENKTLPQNESREIIASEEDNVIQLKNSNNKKELELTANDVKKPEIVYESSNEKAKNLIVVFLLALSILLNIVLIWRR